MEQRFEGDISLAATGAEWPLPRFFASWELCGEIIRNTTINYKHKEI